MTWKASAALPPNCSGVRQAGEGCEEFEHRARPAMGEDDGLGVFVRGAGVDEMQVQPVYVDQGVVVREEAGFGGAPVETGAPVGADVLDGGQGDAPAPGVVVDVVGPARG